MVDRSYLAEVSRRGPEPIFATISGAHLYGFASPDSDVDLRGAFLLRARDVLGLHPPDETITVEDKSKIDLDWVAHDVRKFARQGAMTTRCACARPEPAPPQSPRRYSSKSERSAWVSRSPKR
jgi:hypothetical protein